MCLAGRVTLIAVGAALLAAVCTALTGAYVVSGLLAGAAAHGEPQLLVLRSHGLYLLLGGIAFLGFLLFWTAYGTLKLARLVLQPLADLEVVLGRMVRGETPPVEHATGAPEFHYFAVNLHRLCRRLRASTPRAPQ
jgi:hypothetical protein